MNPARQLAAWTDRAYRRALDLVRNAWAALGLLTAIALLLASVSLAAFGWIAAAVSLGRADALDQRIMLALAEYREPELTAWMRAASFIGSGAFEIPFALAVVAWLSWRRRRGADRLYAWVTLTGWALNGLTKLLFHRARPNIIPRLGAAGWYSFPSGHAMLAPLVLGLAAVLLVREVRQPMLRRIMLGVTGVLVLTIAVSRVYLGVHYPSDVAGALLVGTGWGALWVIVAQQRREGNSTVGEWSAPGR